MTTGTLAAAVPAGERLIVDTSTVLAYLTGSELTSGAAAWIFDHCIAAGRNVGVLSMVTVTETLVRPFRAGGDAIVTVETFLRHFGPMTLVDVTYEVAREAARLRAAGNLPTPDALILASAAASGATVAITNDARWRATIPALLPGLAVCHLGDHLPL